MSQTAKNEPALHSAYHWESTTPDAVYLTQPVGKGAVVELTWKQAMDQARRMAAHLVSLDLPPRSHIAIFSKNTAQWILADVAIWMAGHVSIPLYPTLTADTIAAILDHSESRLVFIGKLDDWDAMKAGIPDSLDRIILPLAPDTAGPTWEEIIAGTEPMTESPRREADEMATIVYTSGSTGMPKGVMVSFGSMAISSRGLAETLQVSPEDRMLSYLPLAHVFERWIVETTSLIHGFHVYFAESLTTFVADLRRAKPTLFVSVPRLWLKFQLGVFAKVPPKKLAFMLKVPILNNKVRKKVLGNLGLEHVRFAGSGSAPIPASLIQWYRDLGLELLEGYGMTENFAYSHVSNPGRARVGYVGSPYPEVEHRISEEGEIQVKGPGSMMGYYKEPEMSAEAFTEDGFLRTGDRGEIDGDDRLRITGRTKELFKTSKGKYVAPAPIENKLVIHPALELARVGGSGFPQPHAIVMLSDEARASLGDPAARAAMGDSLAALLEEVNASVDHHEQLGFLSVVAESWQIENGFLTPTMKLKRGRIEDVYGDQVEGWYEAKSSIVWPS